MKRVTQLNHYEILNLPPSATKADIQTAYSQLWKIYQPDSLAVYSIISGEEREDMLGRVEEAYRILVDDKRRHEYDKSLGIRGFDSSEKAAKTSESVFEPVKPSEDDTKDETIEKRLDPLSQYFFKNFRKIKGVSLREISECTHINLHMLSAIEEGEYHRLPGRAYAIGFLREYAKYLGMDYQKARENMDTWAKW